MGENKEGLMADFFKEKAAGVVLAAGMALGAAGGAQASQNGNLDARIQKMATVSATLGVKSSPAEKSAVVQALQQQAAKDPGFEKKLSALERYNFSIDVNDEASPGKPGLSSTLKGWSGPRNSNSFVLGVNPADLKDVSPAINYGIRSLIDIEKTDNNRLFHEIKSPGYGDSTHQDRLNNYIASRERLEALQGAMGEPVKRDPRRLAEENAGRQKYGMPELPAPQGAVMPEPQRPGVLPAAAEPRSSRPSMGAPTGSIPSATPPSLQATQDRMAGVLGDSNQASGRIPSDIRGPKLSSVDCAAAMNNAAQGGTTVMVGNRLSVSPAEVSQTAKDLLDKNKPQPDLSNWNADSPKSLSRNVGQEFKNQIMSAQQAVDGIRAGGNPQVLTENIANPQIRTLIVTQSKPGMSEQELTKLRTDVMGATGFSETNMAVARQLGVTSQAEATERRVPGPSALCAPGS